MPIYSVYSLRLHAHLPLWHVFTLAAIDPTPDADIELVSQACALCLGETSLESREEEESGTGWHISVCHAPDDADAVLRIFTRLHSDEAVIFEVVRQRGSGYARVQNRSTPKHTGRISRGGSWGSILGYAVGHNGMATILRQCSEVLSKAISAWRLGAGKSTLAGAFWATTAILADDHLVVRQDEQGDSALPGPPRLSGPQVCR
ncbi:MAG: hypothetical protein R2873_08205 [Caldilineaceae bacterium]